LFEYKVRSYFDKLKHKAVTRYTLQICKEVLTRNDNPIRVSRQTHIIMKVNSWLERTF
jgi:hypothetical protein